MAAIDVEDYWWDGDNLIILCHDGRRYRMKKPWLASDEFKGLDYSDDEVTIILPIMPWQTIQADTTQLK